MNFDLPPSFDSVSTASQHADKDCSTSHGDCKVFISPSTAHEVIRQAVTWPQSLRLARFVYSFLVKHFTNPVSEETWPRCTIRHIRRFITIAQLPGRFIPIALTILLAFHEDFPLLYVEGDGAELLFIAAMRLVATRNGERRPGRDLFKLIDFEYHDARWDPVEFEECMFNFMTKLDITWANCDMTKLELIESRIHNSQMYRRETPEEKRALYETGAKIFGKDWFLFNGNLAGPPCKVSCFGAKKCIFDTTASWPLRNNEPSGLPVHMGYRPTISKYSSKTGAHTVDLKAGDFRHFADGTDDMQRWIASRALVVTPRDAIDLRVEQMLIAQRVRRGLPPADVAMGMERLNVRPGNWARNVTAQRLGPADPGNKVEWIRDEDAPHYVTVTQHCANYWQRSTTTYLRDTRVEIQMNHEEMEIFNMEKKSKWGRKVWFGRVHPRKVLRRWSSDVSSRVAASVKAWFGD